MSTTPATKPTLVSKSTKPNPQFPKIVAPRWFALDTKMRIGGEFWLQVVAELLDSNVDPRLASDNELQQAITRADKKVKARR